MMKKPIHTTFDDNVDPMEEKFLEAKKYHIVIVDKDKASIDQTIEKFKNGFFKFTEFVKTKDLVPNIKKEKPDLVILETDLNEADGIEICFELKSDPNFFRTPVAFYSTRADDYTQIAAFDAGCDEFIGKQSKSRLFLARIKSILRRFYELEDNRPTVKKFGNIEIDEEQVMIYKKGELLKLSKKEFQLITLLSSKPGKVFRRNFILTKIWGDDIIVGDRNIDTHIKKIRKKIGKEHIQTVRGIGYKFLP
jgi:two-component system alkaline phosphatase synthesis response regulator PhoP